MNVQGTWTLVDHEQLHHRDDRHPQRLVVDLPEAAAHQRPGRAGERRRHRQLPDLHPGPDRSPCRARPGRRSAPASSTDEAGQVNAIAVDPSDPSGNTVYVGGASGGVWKTTNFLTTNPNGPTWVPLTNFGPSSAVNISSITIFPRNDNPNQSIIIAATGGVHQRPGGHGCPGRRLPDLDQRRRHLEPLRQHRQRLLGQQHASDLGDTSNILPIDSAGPRPRVRRHHGLPGHRRPRAHAHRPGDHLRRLERHQRRHLGEPEHGPDLDAGARRQRDLGRPRPE